MYKGFKKTEEVRFTMRFTRISRVDYAFYGAREGRHASPCSGPWLCLDDRFYRSGYAGHYPGRGHSHADLCAHSPFCGRLRCLLPNKNRAIAICLPRNHNYRWRQGT